jgi:16S rRNA processing protein RimM
MSTFVQIGYTQKTHGIDGALKATIEAPYLEDFLKNERIFLDIKGTKVPYFIAEVRGNGDKLIVQFEEVDKREAAMGLQSKGIFLRPQDLIPDRERELEVPAASAYGHVGGYAMIDKTVGAVGVIEAVLEMPQQQMASVQYQGRTVFVPLNPHFIVEIDSKSKTVTVDLPEGLLDIGV